jgi:DNA mismatch endonuclease, patch repair protein
MKGNRRANTRPEVALRSALHRRGLRFRTDHLLRVGDLRVKADVVFQRQRLAVFVDGCFWHGCPEHGHRPKVNTDYWSLKLERNRRRDARVNAALAGAGWQALRLWEHTPAEEGVEQVLASLAGANTR